MVCELLDFRCQVVNELVGSTTLTIILLGILYFAFCSYAKVGLKTSLWFAVAFFPIVSFGVSGGSFVYAVVTFIAAISLALLHTRLIGNR